MTLLESGAIALGGIVLSVLLAGVAYHARRTDPTATFAGGMGVAFVGVFAYAVGAGFGRLPPLVDLQTLLSPIVVFAALGSLAVVHRMDRPGGRWARQLRSRLLLGVPWGTVVTVAFVLAVYLFVQDGLHYWYDPVTIPFRAWSYLYPLGVLTAGFSHSGAGHLIGNLGGTLVMASIAEYAWGHFPTERGESSFGSLVTNPWIRAFVIFPAVTIAAGVLISVLAMGPVIGFSGVVFAFAGFALVRYPVITVAATVVEGALWQTYLALINPVLTVSPSPSPPAPPGWAQVAIQAHGLGLLLGVVLGAYVFARRDRTPNALRLWTGVLLFAMVKWLWAIYWFRDNGSFVLFRGPGLVVVAILALLVATAIAASDRPLLGLSPRGSPSALSTDGGRESDGGVSARDVALLVLVLSFGLVGGAGAASNMFTVTDQSAPADGIAVQDYTVTYAEDVTNERVAIVNLSYFNETTAVKTSGVIVTSQDRNIWMTVTSKERLAFTGSDRIRLGGVGWEESVYVSREGWSVTGGPKTYKVYLRPEDGDRRLAFVSERATASPTIAGRNVSVLATPQSFAVLVTRNGSSIDTATIPTPGNSTVVDGITFRREGTDLYASNNGTRIKIASKETYEH